jgi:hypothetical protein
MRIVKEGLRRVTELPGRGPRRADHSDKSEPGAGSEAARDRDVIADERDRIADQRDAVADLRDGDTTDRELEIDSTFAAAQERDAQADARDFVADERDMAANLEAFVHDVDDAAAFNDRNLAKQDRMHSKADRIASEEDRYVLADIPPGTRQHDRAMEERITTAVERIEAASGRDQAAQARDREARRREVPPSENA